MIFSSKTLLSELSEITSLLRNQVASYKNLPLETLNFKNEPKRWSALECLEHLNRYGDFYIPEIRKRIEAANPSSSNRFKSNWLGNYFANSMKPKPKLNKMKTFKSMNPIGSQLDKTVIETFLQQQNDLLQLLEQAQSVDLSKTKTNISISKWIKLRLGDTFRVVIYHIQRHAIQAKVMLNMAD